MSEIFVIVAIAVAIFMLPRLAGKRSDGKNNPSSAFSQASGWLRLAIMGSFLWPAGAAFFLKPWNSGWPMFLYVGVGPVMLLWGFYWVLSGFKK